MENRFDASKKLAKCNCLQFNLNPLLPNAPFPYPLKTSENFTVFQCFQGVEKGCIGNEWVKNPFLPYTSFPYPMETSENIEIYHGNKWVKNRPCFLCLSEVLPNNLKYLFFGTLYGFSFCTHHASVAQFRPTVHTMESSLQSKKMNHV